MKSRRRTAADWVGTRRTPSAGLKSGSAGSWTRAPNNSLVMADSVAELVPAAVPSLAVRRGGDAATSADDWRTATFPICRAGLNGSVKL